jgi:hypothetical protein
VWDCAFGRGLCVESIPAAAVVEELARAVAGPARPPEMKSLDLLPEAVVRVIGLANGPYRESQASRKRRFELLVELKHEADQRLERLKESVQRGEELQSALDEVLHAAEEPEHAAIDSGATLLARPAAPEQKGFALDEMERALTGARTEGVRLGARRHPRASTPLVRRLKEEAGGE